MRVYDIAIASLAIDAPTKWTDNLLSHHQIPGILSSQRGISRRISHHALLSLALIRELHTTLGLSVRDAVTMASQLLGPTSPGVHTSGHLRVSLDRAALEHDVAARLRDALESAPLPQRGRRKLTVKH